MEANIGRHSFNFSDAELDKALTNLNDPSWEPGQSWESVKPKGSDTPQPMIGKRTPQPLKRSEGTPLGRAMSHLQNGVKLNDREMATLGKAIASTKSIAKLIPNSILKALPNAFCKKLAAKSIEKTNFDFVTKEFGIKDKKELADLKKKNYIPNNKLLTKDSESEIKAAASELREAKQASKQEAQINRWLKKIANKLGESVPITFQEMRVSDREHPRSGASREVKILELNDLAQEVGEDKLIKELLPILRDGTFGYVGIYSISDEAINRVRETLAQPPIEEVREKKAALSGGVQNSAELPENKNALVAFEERVSHLPAKASELKQVVSMLIDEDPVNDAFTGEVMNILNDNVLSKMEAGKYTSDELSSFVAILRELRSRRQNEAA